MFNIFKKSSPVQSHLFFKTDIHCHLIPGIDDGAAVASEGADLVEQEREWGIERIICTPHITEDTFENTPEIISDAFAKLKAELDARGTDISLEYSAEHRLCPFFFSELEKGHIRPFPNNYLLVENSFLQETWNMDQVIYDLAIKGYKPVLAHPERYQYYIQNRDRYMQLHRSGLLFQVNLLSLAGYYGKAQRQVAEWLIDKEMVDFIGSDMHNKRHAEAIGHYMQSKDYRKHAAALEGRILNNRAFL
ncbi:CpsB/CapC family capsule biosynthesis tyrosine phosphatase [Bacteroides acidifaciens]|uniref:tyrosine-protein phosphatase n=1 Tax=Bacteroides acidifaciens TaxID=85831 RepID=UPI0030154BDF